jgi:NADPH:quinone reductase-like Zn-dependent oxidoreductase
VALTTSRPADGAFAHYTVVQVDKAAILPDHVPFTDGVVLPFAIEAAVCALCVDKPGPCMPGVVTPALGLPFPSLQQNTSQSTGKVLIINGASSSAGSMATQLATASGVKVIAISSAKNFNLVKECGADQVFDRNDSAIISKITEAVKANNLDFIGIFDAISIPETYAQDLEILHRVGGSHLACTHPPPTENVPATVNAGMIFAVNDILAPVFRGFVTPALESGILKCLPPPTIVGTGLEYIDAALKMSKGGVSATKLVVKL